MNNDFDQIEKMLAERLRSIDPPGASADAAWEALSSHLPAPKRKRRFFFLLWSLLLISAASTAVYFYYQPKTNGEQLTADGIQNENEKQNENEFFQEPGTKNQEQIVNGSQLKANGDQNENEKQNENEFFQEPRTRNQEQIPNGYQLKANGIQNENEKQNENELFQEPGTKNQEQIPNGDQIAANGIQNKNEFFQEPRTKNQEQIPNGDQLAANGSQNENQNELFQEPRTKNQEQIPNGDQLAANGSQNENQNENENEFFQEQIAESQKPIADNQEPSPWSIKAALGYNLLSPKDAELANYYPLLGNYVQVSGKYSWTKTYAEAGIQHATWKYGIDYLKTTTDKVLIEDTLLSMVVNAQTGAIISEVYGDTLVNRTTTRKVRYNNSFSSIQVPLEFGYYLNKNKWQFEAGLGVNLIYVYKQSGRYLTTASDITDIITTNNLGVKQFVIQPQLSIGTSYMIHPKWTIGLEAGAGLIPSSWVPSGIDKSMIPLNVGISVVKKF